MRRWKISNGTKSKPSVVRSGPVLKIAECFKVLGSVTGCEKTEDRMRGLWDLLLLALSLGAACLYMDDERRGSRLQLSRRAVYTLQLGEPSFECCRLMSAIAVIIRQVVLGMRLHLWNATRR